MGKKGTHITGHVRPTKYCEIKKSAIINHFQKTENDLIELPQSYPRYMFIKKEESKELIKKFTYIQQQKYFMITEGEVSRRAEEENAE